MSVVTAMSDSVVFVDTQDAIIQMLRAFGSVNTAPPSLYFDLEGINLSRTGAISIMQIYVLPLKRTYLIDVYLLKELAFSTAPDNSPSLRQILEDATIRKVIFDVRNDSDALYAQYGVRLAGIVDLQLMELATRIYTRQYVAGLATCIERDAPITPAERDEFKRVKERGKQLFAPEWGGSYEVFNKRPLPHEVAQYCAQDVHYLARLYSHYKAKITPAWMNRVVQESARRVRASQDPPEQWEAKVKAPKG